MHAPLQLEVVRPLIAPYRPALHGAVQLAVDSPVDPPYRPALQLLHAGAPVNEYVPTGHTAAVGDVEPATQK